MVKLLMTMLILSIINVGCVIPTYMKRSTLNETVANKSDTKITRVLLVGAGTNASRLFLESLSPELIKLFTLSNIQCDFIYAGKIPRRSHVNLNMIVTTQYDAYLVLNPKDTAYIDFGKNKGAFASTLPDSYMAPSPMIGNQYIGDYFVELYTNNNSLEKVWQAELKVDFEVANTVRYRKIAKKIFDGLLINGYIASK